MEVTISRSVVQKLLGVSISVPRKISLVGSGLFVVGCFEADPETGSDPSGHLPRGLQVVGTFSTTPLPVGQEAYPPGHIVALTTGESFHGIAVSVDGTAAALNISDGFPWSHFVILRVPLSPCSFGAPSAFSFRGSVGSSVLVSDQIETPRCSAFVSDADPSIVATPLFYVSSASDSVATIRVSAPPEIRRPVSLSGDAICVVPRSATLGECAKCLLDEISKVVTEAGAISREMNCLRVGISCVVPDGIDHPIMTLFPDVDATINLPKLSSARRMIQRAFLLREDRPLIHPRLVAPSIWGPPRPVAAGGPGRAKLRNVHLATTETKESAVRGRIHLVSGAYDYYHYGQDGIDDKGWGCAYRSMQTLCSWVRLEGYTTKPVPMHREIQDLLVSLGDKPPSFVGSRNWIGAVEISLCLQSLFAVDCRILNIPDGHEVFRHSSAIAQHFDREGTPVMIGGGVLAYTLLGIDWNESTGEAMYLILDPHFTGSDNPLAVKSGGWCAWKKSTVFLKGHFYNLCMPQRPRII